MDSIARHFNPFSEAKTMSGEKMTEKLVRDKIPFIIQKSGQNPVVRKANRAEYQKKLKEKLREEVREFLESGNVGELADVLEVVLALAFIQKKSPKQLEKLRKEKANKRGAFRKRFLLKT